MQNIIVGGGGRGEGVQKSFKRKLPRLEKKGAGREGGGVCHRERFLDPPPINFVHHHLFFRKIIIIYFLLF